MFKAVLQVMKEKYFINARIIDPSQNLDEVGGVIVDQKGKIKAVGKNVKKESVPAKAEKIDLKGKVLIPGIPGNLGTCKGPVPIPTNWAVKLSPLFVLIDQTRRWSSHLRPVTSV